MFNNLWKQTVKIGNHKIDAKNMFYIVPALLLFILSFYSDFKVLGLLLFLYIISMALGLGWKGALAGTILMLITGFISISRFSVDSWLMVGVQMGFACLIGIGLGILRDKYLEYVENYKLTQFGIDNANLMTFLFDGESKIKYVNKYTLKLLEYEEDELIGKDFDWLVSEDNDELYMGCLRDMEYNTPYTFRIKLETKTGGELPAEVNCRYLSYNGGEYGFLFAQNISEMINREKEINHLLYRDSLTGLYNRRFFEEELKRLDTGRQLPISILMIDVNGLKVINDTYGHKAGDKHLKKVGDILKKSIRQEDILARWAGDEFVILMPNTDYEAARMLYSRIKKNCLISYQNGEPVSVAVGIAVKNNSEQEITEVLEKADMDMYKDKSQKQENSGEHIIKFMLEELKEKSFETIEHMEKVKILALGLADRLGLDDKDKETIKFMAQFHDIGMIMLSDEIYCKKEQLEKKDWQELRKHPLYGCRIINSLRSFNDVADNILSHHEWWNGQGYPDGLEGEEIPLFARIIAIADAYEVMRSGRPYKQAKSYDEAISELKHYRWIQFDGRLVDEFIAMLEEDCGLNNDDLTTAKINTEVELDYGDDGRIKEDN